MEDKIKIKFVLIGGSFAAARDNYLTPLGEMAGVELIGNAIESDLRGNIKSASWLTLKLTDLIMGSLVVLAFFIWEDSSGIALVTSLLLGLIPLVLAAVFFYGVATWLNVAPVVVGMVIHQMLEGSHPD
jgi:CHASE2 domain-containing sensor protein